MSRRSDGLQRADHELCGDTAVLEVVRERPEGRVQEEQDKPE